MEQKLLMQNTSYILLEDRFDVPAGTVVFKAQRYDYGLASDDARMTGIEHISVTRNHDGDYPYFTVPVNLLEKIV
jgi:hypothetical protein